MLTKTDLSEIRQIVQEESRSVVKVELKRELRPIKRDIRKIRGDLEFAIGKLDRDRWELGKRFDVHLVKLHS